MRIEDVKGLLPRVREHRRYLHSIPEVGLELPKTKAYVRGVLESLGYQPRDVGPGIVVDIGQPPYIALRADMDALPLEEKRDVPYKSTHPGKMHACGHDAHTAVLLGIAEYFKKNPPHRSVRLIFQPGEEGYFGAKLMVEAGVMDGVEKIVGGHVGGGPLVGPLPTGAVVSRKGPFLAAADYFEVKFKGAGTHGSAPHTGKDPVAAAIHFASAAYTGRARLIDQRHPATLSITVLKAGTVHNIIPDEAYVSGTVRTLYVEDRQKFEEFLGAFARSTAEPFGVQAEFVYHKGYPPLVNTPEVVEQIKGIAERLGVMYHEAELPNMGAEDFAYYLEKAKGAFFFVNTNNPDKGITAPNHSPYFDVDEDVLWIPMAIMISIVEES